MAEPMRFQHFEVLMREDGSLWELGRGAMGITYKAFDTRLRSMVALKVINQNYLNSDTARQRFLREARAAAAIRHPNVATVFYLGEEGDTYFYAMEFIDGETVEAFIKREGPVPPGLALRIASQVSRALGAAQKEGLVHRDIKPSNLMLITGDDGDLDLKVIDFGLAKNSERQPGEDTATLTMAGFLGTPHFASPEQLEEKALDVRSDIYSLGVTLWYMLAGRTPFSGSLVQVMSQHVTREPPFEMLEGAAPEIVSLLRRMMAKNPAERPQTPLDLRREIEACIGSIGHDQPVSGQPPQEDSDFETAVVEPPPTAAPELRVGEVLAGRYRLLEELEPGEYGPWFRAEGPNGMGEVALVVLSAGMLPSREAATRIEEHVATLQKLSHPAIWKIHSLERADQLTLVAYEWIEARPALDVLRERGAFTLEEALPLLQVVASSLDLLDAHQLPCPDVSPPHLLLEKEALAPLVQPLVFSGISEISPDATIIPSTAALLMEQGAFTVRPETQRAFATAELAYDLLGGLRGSSAAATWTPLPALTQSQNALLRQALDPARGFLSATDFVRALSADAGNPPAQAPATTNPSSAPPPLPPTETPPARRLTRSRLPIAIAVIVLLIAGGLGGAWLFTQSGHRPKEPEGAAEPAETKKTAVTEPSQAPEASPSPTPDRYETALGEARRVEETDDYSAALEAYSSLARDFPGQREPADRMEMIAAKLRSSAVRLTPAQFVALRPALEKAAAEGVTSARMLLAENLQEADPADSLKWFLAAADQGQSEAMVQAGLMLSNGRGTAAPDLSGAVTWFEKAAEAGDAEGIYSLGECYLLGKGVPRDPVRAVELFNQGWALGDARSMDTLANLYRAGTVVHKDLYRAVNLFRQAAERGYLPAQANLGVMYHNGEGLQKDPKKAAELFREGAENGNASCMFYYAAYLENGLGGLKADRKQAREWMKKSAQAGDARAIDWCRRNGLKLEDSAPGA